MKMVQGQVEAYRIDLKLVPTILELVDSGYLNEGETKCPNGKEIQIDSTGLVTENEDVTG